MKTKLCVTASLIAFALPAMADDAAKAKLMEAGQPLYATCLACHGPEGKGVEAGPSKMAPSLAGSEMVNGDPAVFALVLMRGIAKENQDYLGMMVSMEGILATDVKLAAVLTYVRNSFGNTASVVTEADAKAFREQWKDTEGSVRRAKLEELEKK